MSPDLEVRDEVNQWMSARARRPLSVVEWCELFSSEFPTIAAATQETATESEAKSVLVFVYEYFAEYTGITFSQVRPNDSLNRDLNFPLICWFDWTLTFCDDFLTHFDLDLSDRFDETDFTTIGELVEFLVGQVTAVAEPSKITHMPAAPAYLRVAATERAIALAA